MGAHKRAEEFAAALDRSADESAALRPELAALMDVVATLQAQQAPAPSASFSASLREALMVEAAETMTAGAVLSLPPRRKGTRERRLAIATSALALVGGTAGMATAAQNALPGESLYQIKRGIEDVRAGLSGDSADKGRTLLDRADTRLGEVRSLLEESGSQPLVASTLESFVVDSTDGADLILDEYASSGDEESVTALRGFTVDAMDQLGELASTAPVGLQSQLSDAAVALRQIDQLAADACARCGGGPAVVDVPASFRAAIDAARVLDTMQGVDLGNDHPLISGGKLAPAKGSGNDKGSAGEGDGAVGGTGSGSTSTPGGEVTVENPEVPDVTLPDLGDVVDDVIKGGQKDAGAKNGKSDKGNSGKSVKDTLPDDLDPLLDPLLP